ncbi:unnamed protein product [Acanthoscelides obtectus]|uniref:Exoribonuclease phosphorolytic domain-containing protein n=1 Tax=Acanthoscelides obtectus TaxID=200917 RepID=A0A9P0PQZ2_ACAOB|nr:unnamed protein product [Acanthoscelides obtectus]CAK1640319.1 Exosome complex component RRP46 [Acanthoscelides obtectus]
MEATKYRCNLDILSRPDGSVLFCEGKTTVIAGLYGPVEVKIQKAHIDKATVDCHYRPKSGLPGVEDRLYESFIRNTCETSLVAALFPRSAVLIMLQEMQNDKQLISCAVNAACMACLSSGIDMKFMFGAVTAFLTKDEELVLTPPIIDKDIKALFVIVFESTEGRILACHTEGCFSKEQFNQAVSICEAQCINVFKFFKQTLLDNK